MRWACESCGARWDSGLEFCGRCGGKRPMTSAAGRPTTAEADGSAKVAGHIEQSIRFDEDADLWVCRDHSNPRCTRCGVSSELARRNAGAAPAAYQRVAAPRQHWIAEPAPESPAATSTGLRWYHWLLVVLALGAVANALGFGDEEPDRLGPDSSCAERYEAVMNSPSVEEFGSDGIVPRAEWIANCEAGR
jgi:hypothetical protein